MEKDLEERVGLREQSVGYTTCLKMKKIGSMLESFLRNSFSTCPSFLRIFLKGMLKKVFKSN